MNFLATFYKNRFCVGWNFGDFMTLSLISRKPECDHWNSISWVIPVSFWWHYLSGTLHCMFTSFPLIILSTHSEMSTASDQWPPGTCLRFIQGHQLGPLDRVYTDQLDGQAEMDISVRMQSPSHCGLYQGQWRMSTSSGVFFGGKFQSVFLYTCTSRLVCEHIQISWMPF